MRPVSFKYITSSTNLSLWGWFKYSNKYITRSIYNQVDRYMPVDQYIRLTFYSVDTSNYFLNA